MNTWHHSRISLDKFLFNEMLSQSDTHDMGLLPKLILMTGCNDLFKLTCSRFLIHILRFSMYGNFVGRRQGNDEDSHSGKVFL